MASMALSVSGLHETDDELVEKSQLRTNLLTSSGAETNRIRCEPCAMLIEEIPRCVVFYNILIEIV